MKIRHLFASTAIPALAIAVSTSTYAQVEITDARTTSVETSTAGDGGVASDVTIASGGSVTVTSGTAVTLDSDNELVNNGTITTTDADDTTGVLISGGVTGNFSNASSISLTASAPTDGITPTSDITTGTGRTGILISGASPFTGNVTNTGSVTVQGQNSAGVRLAAMTDMTGDFAQGGTLSVFGENSVGMDISGNVTGDVAITGTIAATGENTEGVNVSGDVSGTLSVNSGISVSGFVDANGFTQSVRPSLASRETLIETGNLRQSGSAVNISGNIAGGVHFGEERDADTDILISTGSVNMIGSAPAVLIDGNGTPIAIGLVGQITDPNDENFDAELQYAFVNQGNLISDGYLDDVDATTFSLTDATLNGGLNNSGTMRATVYRSGIDPEGDPFTHDSHARVLIIGGGGMAERINNSGTILARGFEAVDSAFADTDNIQAPNTIYATAIDILAGGSLETISNIGNITALVTGRDGEAVAIRDASGTFIELNNSGTIDALGINSDLTGEQTSSFNLIAIDVSANTSGFTLNQTVYTDPDTEVATTPAINGDILLGSGDDLLNIAGGSVDSNIRFGDGADRLLVSNGATVTGSIADSDGQLEVMVTGGSSLTINSADDFDVTTATFDSTSTYAPFIDPQSGEASIMMASGDVTFEDGATIDPRLATVLTNPTTSFTIIQAANLITSANFGSVRGENSPFMYDTVLTRDPTDANTLILTLSLRDTAELGLDTAQTAMFASAFEAMQSSDALGSAFVGLTDEASFNNAYRQLMPEFSAAALQFVMANIDGATGAVGSHLKSARRSQEKPGGTWIEQIAFYADKDLTNLSEQYRGYGFGITGGFDTAFGPFHNAGLNIGFATTEVEDVLGVDEPLDVLTVQAGLYGGMEFGNIGIELYAGGGYDDFEANRVVSVGSYTGTAQGNWSGYHANASASAGYNMNIGKFYLRPSATLSYLNLNENAFIEQGSEEIIQAIDARQVDVGTATGILEFGRRFNRDRAWFAPSVRFGYRNDFINGGIVTSGNYVSGSIPFVELSDGLPANGLIFGLSFASGSDYASFAFDYDTDIRNGYIRHTARIVVRLIF